MRPHGTARPIRASIAATGALLALAGCSASTPTETAGTATAWTMHEAGQHFQALYVPAAKINNKYVAALNQNDFPTAAGLAGQLATNQGTFLVELSKGRWPSVARGPVKALIAAMLPVRRDNVDLSNSRTKSQFDAVPLAADNKKMIIAFDQVDLALGLSPV